MQLTSLVHLDTLSCEPILRRALNGDLFILCECGGVKEPSPENRVLSFRSIDNGRTWSNGESVWPACDRAQCLTDIILLDGTFYGFFLSHDGSFCGWQSALLASVDDGRTWTEMKAPPWYTDRMLVRGSLRDRDNVYRLPYQRYHTKKKPSAGHFFPAIDSVENGVLSLRHVDVPPVFTAQPIVTTFDGIHQKFAWTESAVARCPDGALRMLMRLDRTGCLWKAESWDDGISWSLPERTEIPNPGNKPCLISIDENRIALLHTPSKDCRYPFALWLSCDGMKTWERRVVLADFPGTYHYADGFAQAGSLYLAIEHNRRDILFFQYQVDG